MLQKSGMIEYSRGIVTILDREKLIATTCSCYAVIEHRKEKWLAETQQPN
jgi:hypothetical protein